MDLEQAYETVNLYRRGAELRIELNRPEAMNAWNTQFGDDLRGAVERAAAYERRRDAGGEHRGRSRAEDAVGAHASDDLNRAAT